MGWPLRIFAVAIGLVFAVIAFKKDIGIRKGRTGPVAHTVTPTGRICLFLIGVLCVFVGVTGITEFWYFSK